MKPLVLLRTLSLLVVLVLVSTACGGPPAIGEVVTAKGLDADGKAVNPTSTYSSDDPIFISVGVNNLVVGSVVDVKYKLAGADYESSTLTADKEGSGFYGFQLTTPQGHPGGDYTADVYLDGKLAKSVSFNVVASGPPSIVEVVVAKSLDADGKPVDPTTSFAPSDKVIVSVLAKNLVIGTKIKAVFSSGGASQDTTTTADKPGPGYYTFSLAPDATGLVLGDYKAEIYLDGTLVKTVTFTVK